MNTKEQKQQRSNEKDLKSAVFSRIRNEHICPKSRWNFICMECLVWFFWIITVVLGAIAVSEAIYLSMHSGIEFFDVTHGGITPFLLESFPYLWLIAFALMVAFAYYNMRHTRRGYRYPFWQVVGSSIIFTAVGGFILNTAGVSHKIDRMMDDMVPGYVSAQDWQKQLWMRPEDGRLSGTYIRKAGQEGTVRFGDITGKEWILAVHELPPEHSSLLKSGDRVRLIGEMRRSAADDTWTFYTCGVMPWMPERGHTIETLRASRTDVKAILDRYVPADGSAPSASMLHPSLRCREVVKQVFHKNY